MMSESIIKTWIDDVEETDEYHIEGLKLEITEQIFQAMEDKKVSQSELARRLGKNRAFISKILQGKNNFTLKTLVLIARKLGMEWEMKLRDK